MAGGIPLSAKFDVSIAEPLDSKLESVSTFSELASTPFPYKGMQKLVEDEGDNGIIYYLGADLTTWSTSTDEDALKQGDNTLTEDLELVRDSNNLSKFKIDDRNLTLSSVSVGNESVIDISDDFIDLYLISGGLENLLLINTAVGITFKNQILGNGIKFNDRAVDEANVDFSTDDNNLLSIGKAKENLLQQGSNTLTEDLSISGSLNSFSASISDTLINQKTSSISVEAVQSSISSIDQPTGSLSYAVFEAGKTLIGSNIGGLESTINTNSNSGLEVGIQIKEEISGKGISFENRTVDEANVDFSTDDNNLLSIGKAKENLLQQGTNTLTEDLEFVRTGTTKTSTFILDDRNVNLFTIEQSTGNEGEIFIDDSEIDLVLLVGGLFNELLIKENLGIVFKSEILGNGIKFNDRAVDEANVDFATDDNNLLSIGKAKENLQQKHTVTDFTDAFTIPNGTNNATLTMTNATNKDVTITATSFSNVGDACELSSLLGVGYPIVVADTGVALVDPNGVASDSFNIKGLRRMNDVGGVVQIQLY